MHCQHHIADVLRRDQPPQAAHIIELAALGIESAAGIAVVGAQRVGDGRNGKSRPRHFGRIQHHLILHGLAAQAGIIGHAGDRFELPFHHPVINRFQLHRRTVAALQHIAVDQTRRRKHGRDRGRHPAGQAQIGNALINPLPRKINIRAVFIGEDDVRQSVERNGADHADVRDAVHLQFNGHGDETFHLLGGLSRPLRDDLDHGRGKIGISIHREPVERPGPGGHQQPCHDHHQKTLPQRRGYHPVND